MECQGPASMGYGAVPSATAARDGTAHSPLGEFHSCDLKQKRTDCTEHLRGNYIRGKPWSIYSKSLNMYREHTTRATELRQLRQHFFSLKHLFTVKKIFFLFRRSVARAKIGTQLGLASQQGGESGRGQGGLCLVMPGAQPVQELAVLQGKCDL